jgi:hypothetical protein
MPAAGPPSPVSRKPGGAGLLHQLGDGLGVAFSCGCAGFCFATASVSASAITTSAVRCRSARLQIGHKVSTWFCSTLMPHGVVDVPPYSKLVTGGSR